MLLFDFKFRSQNKIVELLQSQVYQIKNVPKYQNKYVAINLSKFQKLYTRQFKKKFVMRMEEEEGMVILVGQVGKSIRN